MWHFAHKKHHHQLNKTPFVTLLSTIPFCIQTHTLPGNLHLSTNNKLHLKINISASTIQFITSRSSRYSQQVKENVVSLSNKKLVVGSRYAHTRQQVIVVRVPMNHRNFRSVLSLLCADRGKGNSFVCLFSFTDKVLYVIWEGLCIHTHV